ncbi:MAG: protein TolQ [Desulfobacteraceae bacterium]|nr:protein TolQ [Desulfobacteraceae bacterium]
MIRNAGPMVQVVLFLLFVFSASSWTIILIKTLYLRRAARESDFFIEIFWESRDFAIAFKEAENFQGSPLARIFCIGYIELRKLSRPGTPTPSASSTDSSISSKFGGTDNVKRALRRAINIEVTRMTQMVPFLATTGNTAPFIGLFGTVWGIMNSFHGIGMTGTANLATVAPGISEALVATAAGLAVAIPSVIAFNYFMQKIRNIESELQSFYADFMNIIERDIIPAKGDN